MCEQVWCVPMSGRHEKRWASLLIVAALVALLSAVPGEAADLEWCPTFGGGYSKIFDAHGAISAAVRLHVGRTLFVQSEYLWLPAEGHTDHGPTVLVGLAAGNRETLRPFVGLGAGPVKGYQGDDGIYFIALGASHPLVRQHGVFVQAEARYGLLGETTYSQFAVAIGVSR